MESRNPENEAVDGRPLSQKLEDEGKGINPEPSVQNSTPDSEDKNKDASDITDDEAKEMANACPHVEKLISELGGYNVRSLDDVKRIEEVINRYELYRKYGD